MEEDKQQATKPKVLLIEDDKYLCRAYKDGLERAGLEIILAYDGVEGLEKIKSEKPDLILLDLILPDKSGFEVLREVSLDKNLKKIPIVVLSNLGQKSDIQTCRELGAKDYLVKADFTMKDVIKKVKFHLVKSGIPWEESKLPSPSAG